MWYDIEAFNTNEAAMKMRKIKSTSNKIDSELLNLVIEEKAAKAAINSKEDITGYEKVCLIEQLISDYARRKRVLLAEKKKTDEEEAALLAVAAPGGGEDGGGRGDDDEEEEEEAAGEDEPADKEVDAASAVTDGGDSKADSITRVTAMAKMQGLC
jgi:hypothetical protein